MNYFSKCAKFIGQSVFGPKFIKKKKKMNMIFALSQLLVKACMNPHFKSFWFVTVILI